MKFGIAAHVAGAYEHLWLEDFQAFGSRALVVSVHVPEAGDEELSLSAEACCFARCDFRSYGCDAIALGKDGKIALPCSGHDIDDCDAGYRHGLADR